MKTLICKYNNNKKCDEQYCMFWEWDVSECFLILKEQEGHQWKPKRRIKCCPQKYC